MHQFNSMTFDNLELPSMTIDPGQIIRVELQSKDQCDFLFKYFSNLSFNKIIIGKGIKKSGFLSNQSVFTYLKNCDVPEKEILSFCLKSNIARDEKIRRLTTAQQRTVELKSLISSSDFFLINSSGMYLQCLEVSYEVLYGFLNRGGSCLEFTYPPYGGNDLDKILGTRLKVLKFN